MRPRDVRILQAGYLPGSNHHRRVTRRFLAQAWLLRAVLNPAQISAARDPIDSLANAPLAASDRDAVDDAIAEPDPADERVIEAVGAILFAEKSASGSAKASVAAPESTPVDVTVPVTIPSYSNLCKTDSGLDVGCWYVIELMLRIDYGFPDHQPIGPRLPAPGIQDYFWEMSWLAVSYFADFLVATTRRRRQGHVPDRKAWDHVMLMLEQYEEIQVHI